MPRYRGDGGGAEIQTTTKSVMHSVAHYLADRNKTLRRLRGAVVEKVGTLKIEYWRLE